MADPAKQMDTNYFICNPNNKGLDSRELDDTWGMFSFATCQNHDHEEVKRNIEDIVNNKDGVTQACFWGYGPGVVESTVPGATQAITSLPPQALNLTRALHVSPKKQPPVKQAYRPDDYFVQNLPPGDNDNPQDDPTLRDSEKVLQLAYAWSQLEAAKTALSSMHDTLEAFDADKLPARTLKQRMKQLRDMSKEMEALMDGADPAD